MKKRFSILFLVYLLCIGLLAAYYEISAYKFVVIYSQYDNLFAPHEYIFSKNTHWTSPLFWFFLLSFAYILTTLIYFASRLVRHYAGNSDSVKEWRKQRLEKKLERLK